MEICGQLQSPAAFSPGTHHIRGSMSHRAELDTVERRKISLALVFKPVD
jgi:hypothetical protein